MSKLMSLCGVAAAALAFAPVACAQKQSPPPAAKPVNVRLPARRHFTLANGLQVTMVPFGTVPRVTVSLSIRVGAVHEAVAEEAMAELTAAMMNEGTATLSAAQVAEQAALMGGDVTVASRMESTTIGEEVLSENAAAAIALVADVVMHPALPAAELTRLKGDLVRQFAIERTQAQPIAQAAFRKSLFGEHPYGRWHPTDTTLQSYSIEQVRHFHAKNFGAGRAHLYVAGVFDAAAVEAAIRRVFAAWPRGTPAPVTPVPPRSGTRTLTLIDRPDAVQSTVMIGLRVPPPSTVDATALEVADALLGGAFGSRITSNIREQKGYTYSPYSTVRSFRGESYWAEQADVTTNVTGASLKEIIGEIDRLRGEAPPDVELTGIKNNLAGIFSLQVGSRYGLIGQLSYADLQGLGDRYLTTYVQRVLAVTPVTVRRVTRAYLAPDRMAIVIVGDRKTVTSQVAQFRGFVP